MVDVIEITVEEFRTDMPAFADTTKYSDGKISVYLDRSTCYVSAYKYGSLCEKCRKYALELMTAHLLTLNDRIMSGDTSAGGRITSTSIDKISVSLDAPQTKNDWAYWLSLTPYGLELLALLNSKAPAGIYSGGKCYRVFR